MRRESSVTCLMDQEGMRFCSSEKAASAGERVIRRKVPGPARCQGRRQTVLRPSTFTRANGNPQLEADDTTELRVLRLPDA